MQTIHPVHYGRDELFLASCKKKQIRNNHRVTIIRKFALQKLDEKIVKKKEKAENP